jgi:4-amino-4-deoxy-L-arabinose transferase-like glycosyltransferase
MKKDLAGKVSEKTDIKHYLLYLFLVILVILVNVVISERYLSLGIQQKGDDREYHETAKAIMQGSSTVRLPAAEIDIGRNMAPGYSFLIAGVYRIFGLQPRAVYFVHILFQIIVTLIMYYVLSRLTNGLLAFIFCLWLTAYFQIWKYNYLIMTEISTIFLLTLVMLSFFKFIQTAQNKYLILFSFIFGILIFVNNRFIFHFFGFGIYFTFKAIRGKFINWRQVALVICGVVIVLLPWHIRQYNTYGRLVFFSPKRTSALIPDEMEVQITGAEIVPGAYYSQETKTYEEYVQNLSERKNWSSTRTNKTLEVFTQEKYNELVSKHNKVVSSLPRKIISRLAEFWRVWQFDFSFGPGGDSRIVPPARASVNILNILFLFPMFALFPVGVYYGMKTRNMTIGFCGMMVIFHWLLHGLIHYLSRYRISVLPFIFFVAWYGLYRLVDKHWISKHAIKKTVDVKREISAKKSKSSISVSRMDTKN